MLKHLLLVGAVLMPGSLVPLGNLTHAAWFQVSTTDSYPPAPPTTWNPRATDKLIAVMSEATDVSIDQSGMGIDGRFYTMTSSGKAAAATYGSDTSADWVADPRLTGLSIEPMADTMATSSMTCLRDGDPWSLCPGISMAAYASASVNHRVIQRRTGVMPSPETQAIIDQIATVRLHVDFKLSATASKAEGPDKSYAMAEVQMGAYRAIASANPEASCPPGAHCYLNEHEETINLRIAPSTEDRTVPFLITATANVSAQSSVEWGNQTLSGSAQAVADPFLYIDPDWAYAQFFMVQQESLLHPGEWAEVTRVWQQPIPEPETWVLLLAGLGLVSLAARRYGQRVAWTERSGIRDASTK